MADPLSAMVTSHPMQAFVDTDGNGKIDIYEAYEDINGRWHHQQF